MKLRTEIEIDKFDKGIDYSSEIFTIGSCFAQRVGERMERAKLRTTINPTGTLFNPISLCNTVERLYDCRLISEEELHQNSTGWYHFDFHSSLSAPTKEQTLQNINSAIERGHEALTRADWVVITLGTSWVYSLAGSDEVLANCHKLPARNFSRSKLSVEQITERLSEIIEKCLKGKNIILTVSPIRHIADGLSENSLSKATLRVAIDNIVQRYDNTIYFPAYEVLVDDLRDYRFYSEDMVHPTNVAVEYIWDLFREAALTREAKELLPRVMKIVLASEHRPINPLSEAHRLLCESQLRAIGELRGVDMSKESEYFSSQLKINL